MGPIPPSSLASILAVPILYLGGIQGATPLPSQRYNLPIASQGYDWEVATQDLRYQIEDTRELFDKVAIFHRVISQLLEKSEELDPDFSAIINRRFWDLV